MARFYLLAATANVWVFIAILLAAFAVQIATSELPCPLCVMQRIALMLTAVGPLYILLRARDGVLTCRDAAVGNGLAIIAALVGLTASGRQVLLHILPGNVGFGSPVLGLHLYTWCLIAFLAQIAASGVMLMACAWLEEKPIAGRLTAPTAIAFVVIVTANLISVIAEAGLHWELPADPVRYLLFK